jgi:hypothetical protein
MRGRGKGHRIAEGNDSSNHASGALKQASWRKQQRALGYDGFVALMRGRCGTGKGV